MTAPEPAAKPPLLTVVRGNPSHEDIAALLAVVTVAGSGTPPEKVVGRAGQWAAPRLRRPLQPGPQAWRASGLPG